MTAFSDRLVEANRATWTAMAAHPFVLGLADGTLPDSALRAWVQQDRVFVLEERRVVAALRAHGPPAGLDRLLAGLDGTLLAEGDAFAATATARGFAPVAEPWPVCLGYTSYLLCCAHDGILEGLTGLYAAELAGSPSPAIAGRLGSVFTGAVRFELAFWEMCWRGQGWPG